MLKLVMLFNGASELERTDDQIAKISPISGMAHRQQSMNRNLISSTTDEIGVEEQSNMAEAMENELKTLKAKMGILDGFGMINTPLQTENDEDTDVATPRPDGRNVSFKNERSESMLEETAGLRQKLEHITDKINRIRAGLHEKSEESLLAEINEQLTSIQDSIEDAENDVTSLFS